MTAWLAVPRVGEPEYGCNRRGCGRVAVVDVKTDAMRHWVPFCELHRPDREPDRADELAAATRDRGRALHDLAEEKRKSAALAHQLRAAHEANRVLHADVAELMAAGHEVARFTVGYSSMALERWRDAVQRVRGDKP